MDEMLPQAIEPQALAPEVIPPSPESLLPPAAKKLMKFINSVNIADDLEDDVISEIGRKVSEGYKRDWESYEEWRTMMDKVLKLVRLEHEPKNFPWENASNVKYPLISEAAMQFAARAYPEIIQGSQVVKTQVIGEDPSGEKAKRGVRISQHMSWQVLEDMPAWEANMDMLLHMLPIYGTVYKKTYFDTLLKKNVSITLTPFELAVNNNVKDNSLPKRMTHIMSLYDNDVVERVQAGLWTDQTLGPAGETRDPKNPGETSQTTSGDDASFHTFLEQHCWHDLDGDGYEEPYIVTIHRETTKVMRIVACYDENSVLYEMVKGKPKLVRISPNEYFTKFIFLPDPTGAWLGTGFGPLLCASNEAINSVLNQMIDAGTLANLQGGYKSKDAKVSGTGPIKPGEFRSTDIPSQDLQAAFFPLPFKEPSGVLFQLLGTLVESSKEFASMTSAMSGTEMPANAAATSVLAVIDQGMKVFNGIHKRVYRALKSEFKKIAWLNSRYMDDQAYFRVLDAPGMEQIGRNDYAQGDFDIVPVADPNMATAVQKLAKAQALMEWSNQPGVNKYPINQMFLDALQIPNQDRILIPPDKIPPPSPDPMMIDVENKGKAIQMQFQVEMKKLEQAQEKAQAEIKKILADALLSIAKAEAAEAGAQMEQYQQKLDHLSGQFDMHMQSANLDMGQEKHMNEMAMRQRELEAAQNAQLGDMEEAPAGPGLP